MSVETYEFSRFDGAYEMVNTMESLVDGSARVITTITKDDLMYVLRVRFFISLN
jgi:hypothetical protein